MRLKSTDRKRKGMSMAPRRRSFDEDDRIKLAELASSLEAADNDYRDLRATVLNLGKRIDETVVNLVKRIDDMASSINSKIDQRFQPQWQTWIAGIMLVGAAFFSFIQPIQNTNVELRDMIKGVTGNHQQFVRDVNAEFNRRNEIFIQRTEHVEYRSRIDNALNGIRTRMDRVETAIDREQERGRK